MKNILSYITPISGKDILDWFEYQAENETSHKREYNFMIKKWSNIQRDRTYKIVFQYPKSNKHFNKKKIMPFIVRVIT
mgnify:FL=1